MAELFDPETLERFRKMPPRRAYEEAKNAVYRLGATSSQDFVDIYEELVEQGILTWEQVEEFGER